MIFFYNECKILHTALCGYPLVKVPVENFCLSPPFSRVPIFSDRIFGVYYIISFTFQDIFVAKMTTSILNIKTAEIH